VLSRTAFNPQEYPDSDVANAFGLIEKASGGYVHLSLKGKNFFEWLLLNT